jgi:serine/threonine protein kinase
MLIVAGPDGTGLYARDRDPFASGSFARVYHGHSLVESSVSPTVIKEEDVPIMFAERMLQRAGWSDAIQSDFIAPGRLICTEMISSIVMRMVFVMPFYPTTLHGWIRQHVRTGTRWSDEQTRCFIVNLFRGLDYLHTQAGIVHGDITTKNLLLDHTDTLVIADMGSIATIESHTGTHNTETAREYRPPEGLMGGMLTASYDMWSAGCILAELLLGQPLFMMFSTCATWPEAMATLARVHFMLGPNLQLDWAEIFALMETWALTTNQALSDSLTHVLTHTLQFDPTHRYLAADCLKELDQH